MHAWVDLHFKPHTCVVCIGFACTQQCIGSNMFFHQQTARLIYRSKCRRLNESEPKCYSIYRLLWFYNNICTLLGNCHTYSHGGTILLVKTSSPDSCTWAKLTVVFGWTEKYFELLILSYTTNNKQSDTWKSESCNCWANMTSANITFMMSWLWILGTVIPRTHTSMIVLWASYHNRYLW